MKNSLIIIICLICWCCQNETINSFNENVGFWEKLRLNTESDNIELNFSTDLNEKKFTIRFINSKFNCENEMCVFYSDSLINLIYKNIEIDTNYSIHSIEFIKANVANEITYTLPELNAKIGLERVKNKDFKKAIYYFNQAIKYRPDKSSYYFNLAHCLFEEKTYDKSIDILEKYKNLDGENRRYIVLSARNYKALNDKEKNSFFIEELKKNHPEYKLKEIDTIK